MTNFQLYNTLTKKKCLFEPIDPNNIKIYACGPTVYHYAHIGNARMAVSFDLLVRVLRCLYPKVTYVSNITDIDDKIIKACEEDGLSLPELTQKFAEIYNQDMAVLNVQKPDQQPKATEHMSAIINLISNLIEKEYAYVAENHVLFHVPSFAQYGCLSGRNKDDQLAGSRVEVAPYKKDPGDFVLWKPSTEDQPGWVSPWGRGRPGWHIECSAMVEATLGLPIDIHVGGNDLTFPHHENELAQSCCGHASPDDPQSFVRYWMHNGFVTVNEEKMSKSIGNTRLVHDLIQEYSGETLRLSLLSSHYRQPLNWSQNLLGQSQTILERFYRVLHETEAVEIDLNSVSDTEKRTLVKPVLEPLCDDLNTSKSMAELNQLAKTLSKASSLGSEDVPRLKVQFLLCAQLLGVLYENPDTFLGYSSSSDNHEEIQALVDERTLARKEKDFQRADEIRAELTQLGVEIEDSKEGVSWRFIT